MSDGRTTIYCYRQNDYNSLTVMRTANGGIEVIVAKDRGNRTEWINIPAREAGELAQALKKPALRDEPGAAGPVAPAAHPQKR